MGIGQAQRMLRGFQDQLSSGQFGRGAMDTLEGAGLGGVNPRRFFSTPFDEQFLRQSLMQQILGGMGQRWPGAEQLFGGGQSFDDFSGGLKTNPFDIQPGPPQFGSDMIGGDGGGIGTLPAELRGGGGVRTMPVGRGQESDFRSRVGGGDFSPVGIGGTAGGAPGLYRPPSMDDLFAQFRGRIPATSDTQSQMPVGATPLGVVQTQTPGVGSFPGIAFSAPADMVSNPGAAGLAPTGQGGFAPWQAGMAGLPELDPTTRNQLDQIFAPKLDTLNRDFADQRQTLMNDMFGRGLNASTIAADAGGRLLYGRSDLMNQILGERAQTELSMRQQAKQDLMSKANINFAGGGGGGGGSLMGIAGDTSSLDALSFEQKLALQELGLKQQELGQQGALGGRELDIRQQLGLGELGLGRSGQQQDLLRFLMGQGLQRQQGGASLRLGDLERMTGFLGGREQLMAGLAGQQAQMEAQRRGLMGGIFGALGSIGGSLLGGGFGSSLGQRLFGGGRSTP